MHYYPFNIGDYARRTSRLSLLEDLAYRRLLDVYYLNERPFNGCSTDVARDIGMQGNQTEVDYILNKFFPKTGDNWVNSRADTEISIYQGKIEAASKAGKASAKSRRNNKIERPFNDRATTVQPTKNQEPRTKNHKPITNTKKIVARFAPPKLEEVQMYCMERNNFVDPENFINHYETNGWMRGKTKIKDWKACVRTWEKNQQKEVSKTSTRDRSLLTDLTDTGWAD